MDFNDWKNQNFRKALAEMEGIYGQIDCKRPKTDLVI